jgi:metallo-beta-lactamase class B
VKISQLVMIGFFVTATGSAQTPAGDGRGNQDPGPAVTVRGHTFTQRGLFQRNIGGPNDQTTQFPPHKIIGNIYYVGTKSLAAFLVVTSQGNVLINSTYERNVPTVEKSIEQLGFKLSDTKILLGSHAHGDHQEGDAMVKQLTGAQVIVMAEDVPALQAMKPGGKEHPIDKVIHDGDTVTLGDTTLVAHLTPGHTRGCTTWTMKASEGGKTYDVAIIGSFGVNPGFKLVNNTAVPGIADEFLRTFKTAHSLHVDVPLGSHPGMYNLDEKYANLAQGGPNPFIDPDGYQLEVDIDEAMFRAVLAQQRAPQAMVPDVYMPRGTRPAPALAPGMKVTDLGKDAHTFRINLTKGDEIMSGLTEFAEKYHIRNAHFTALGAVDKGVFGWTDLERGLAQKKIELNQEAEIVSLMGSIAVDNQGRVTVHAHGSVALSDGTVRGGHWFEAHVSIIAEVFVTEENVAQR